MFPENNVRRMLDEEAEFKEGKIEDLMGKLASYTTE